MIEQRGDIFSKTDANAICFTSNGILNSQGELVMGAGVAKAFKDRWPKLPSQFGAFVKATGNKVYSYSTNSDSGFIWIASFPTKHHWRNPSDLKLIVKSSRELVSLADKLNWKRVYLPYPGIGFGGLDKSVVREAIKDILDDRFIVLTL